jgi:biofilm protein TabA
MISDRLANAALYKKLHPQLADALDWLAATDLSTLPLGKIPIEQERLFALVQQYTPVDPSQGKLEAHRDYWDVQFVSEGAEHMEWVSLNEAIVSEAYDATRDVTFFAGRGTPIRVPSGSFIIFGPNDVHMPGVWCDRTCRPVAVRKIVLKVKIEHFAPHEKTRS